jgi:hypothetical protein
LSVNHIVPLPGCQSKPSLLRTPRAWIVRLGADSSAAMRTMVPNRESDGRQMLHGAPMPT